MKNINAMNIRIYLLTPAHVGAADAAVKKTVGQLDSPGPRTSSSLSHTHFFLYSIAGVMMIIIGPKTIDFFFVVSRQFAPVCIFFFSLLPK